MPKTLLDLINDAQRSIPGSRILFSDVDLARFADGTFGEGTVGPTGPPGDIVWFGAWNAGSLYLADDAVESNGTSYIAVVANTNSQPPSANWNTLAAKGATGNTGATGAQGPSGNDGAPGAQGPTGPQGDPGPNSVSGSTTTAFSGILKGTGTVVAVASAPTDYVATVDSRLSDARTPTAHSTSHKHAGTDEVAAAVAAANAIPKAGAGGVLDIGWVPLGSSSTTVCVGNDGRLSDARTPTAHASTHKSAGTDAIKLDELAAPTDVTTLDATASAHGLMQKFPGGTTTFLRADGTFTTVPGGSATITTVEVNLGALAWRGRFTVTDAGVGPTSKVAVWQAPGPYTGKGTRADEAEMDPLWCVATPGTGQFDVLWRTMAGITTTLDAAGRPPTLAANAGAAAATAFVLRQTILGQVKGNVKFHYMTG